MPPIRILVAAAAAAAAAAALKSKLDGILGGLLRSLISRRRRGPRSLHANRFFSPLAHSASSVEYRGMPRVNDTLASRGDRSVPSPFVRAKLHLNEINRAH